MGVRLRLRGSPESELAAPVRQVLAQSPYLRDIVVSGLSSSGSTRSSNAGKWIYFDTTAAELCITDKTKKYDNMEAAEHLQPQVRRPLPRLPRPGTRVGTKMLRKHRHWLCCDTFSVIFSAFRSSSGLRVTPSRCGRPSCWRYGWTPWRDRRYATDHRPTQSILAWAWTHRYQVHASTHRTREPSIHYSLSPHPHPPRVPLLIRRGSASMF